VKERFVRLDKSRSLPGSGLGLSLVEAIADPDRPGLNAALIFPRAKSDGKSVSTAST